MWSLSRVEAWLEFLDSQSTRARNLIDSGSSSSSLRLVLSSSFELFSEFRSLTDPGGFREFSSVFPSQATIARGYLVHNWKREQECRSLRGQLPTSLGGKSFRDLRLALFSSSLDTRERSLEVLGRWVSEWAPRASLLLPLSEKLEVPRETGPSLRSSPAPETTASGLFLARPEDIEALRLGLEPPQFSSPKEEPQAGQSHSYTGLLLLFEELGRALQARTPDFWGHVQATSRCSDYVDLRFRPLTLAPFFGRKNYQFIHLFPFGDHARGPSITKPQGDVASAIGAALGLAADNTVIGAAIYWSLASHNLARRVFEAPPESKTDWARLWVGSLLFMHLLSKASAPQRSEEPLSLPFEIPRSVKDLVEAEAEIGRVPGNSDSVPFGFVSLSCLQQGYRMHLELQERYDFDWLLNPRLTEMAKSEIATEGEPGDLLLTLSQTAFL